ncbi:unnamed protein product [Hymenolepis diminuta]|uniref:Uncharacterized protein n=1 Tax=Hymenolepis diminuta TaxID=6216 RepID=A0A564Z4J6_HYMDI|nr:unnamed protein product [Hymenolepis diminuta]
MKSATTKGPTTTATTKSTTSTWKFGNIFSKNNSTTTKKEDTHKNTTTDTKKTLHWTEKVKGLNANDKAKVLETELKTLEEELRERNETIKCLQELRSGVGLKSSAADFHRIKDKECRQLIDDIQALYHELEDFNQTVNFEDKSKYEPPVAPVAKLMTTSNGSTKGEPIVPRHYQRINSNTSKGPVSGSEGNSKLANIRWNWEEHNLKIVDLNNRLKAAYNYIKEMEGKAPAPETKSTKGPISAKNVSITEKAPSQEEKHEPDLWYVPEEKRVDKKQKNALLSLAGDGGSDSDEDVYKASPAKSFYEPPSKIEKEPISTMMTAKVYAQTYESGEKPDWLDEAGEIHITPVQAVFINSIHDKAEKMGTSNKNSSAQNSTFEPKMASNDAQSKNQPISQFSSQHSPAVKSKVNESDLSDADDLGKGSNSGYKPYDWSNYHPQTSYTTSSTNSSQAQVRVL